MRTTDHTSTGAERLASWLEHQLRLLEVLQFRFDGLERLLKAGRDHMIVRIVDEIDEVRSQLGIADLHRDIAVSSLTANWSLEDLPTLSMVIERSDTELTDRLAALQSALHETIEEIAATQDRCAATAAGMVTTFTLP